MGTVLRALLASIVINVMSLLDGAALDMGLFRNFIIYFVVLWITFYIIRKVEERKENK